MTPISSDETAPALRLQIEALLAAFNASTVGSSQWRPLVIPLKGEADGVCGGLCGSTYYGWLNIELLFIPDVMRNRGFGSRLVTAAETEAFARGCRGAWVDTFEFQAKGFYERLGYAVFGELNEYPAGHARFYLQKSLVTP